MKNKHLVALVFGGQGTQYEGMAQNLIASNPDVIKWYHRAERHVGVPLVHLTQQQLNETWCTQIAVFLYNHCVQAKLQEQGFEFTHTAGLSLGEYNALVSASCLSFDAAFDIVAYRGRIMHEAFEPNSTGMVAVLGSSEAEVESLIAHIANVDICNSNDPKQCVIGGTNKALERACHVLKEHKIRTVSLNVGTVSHMFLLKEVSNTFENYLKKYTFDVSQHRFFNNFEGRHQTSGFVTSLSKQISHRTQFMKIINTMLDEGVREFVEVGPKGSLSRFIKNCASARSIEVRVTVITNLE